MLNKLIHRLRRLLTLYKDLERIETKITIFTINTERRLREMSESTDRLAQNVQNLVDDVATVTQVIADLRQAIADLQQAVSDQAVNQAAIDAANTALAKADSDLDNVTATPQTPTP
jgi:uncharacterized protein YoxC